MAELKDTLLWKSFYDNANDEQRYIVSSFCQKAAQRLLLVRDSLPTYTLHNELHSLNVIIQVENLLGNRISELDTLEKALLILSAYYHDIGMVFTEIEIENIQNEPEFGRFLLENQKYYLELKEFQNVHGGSAPIPIDIAEAYCRWIHADKSESYVTNNIDKILWNGYPINEALSTICKSHSYSTSEINKWESLKIDFLGNTDLLFCSIILRLADILDFDNTRSPDEVYKYLGLNSRRTKREELSDIEWRKHLCSSGFIFTNSIRKERYNIKIAASPSEPSVEYDLRKFLSIIEEEFDKCNAILRFTNEKWRDFKLPQSIVKNDIISQNYTYGEYKFTLEQDQVFNLLMGENLYSDPYVFIRELAQNAIDTTRHRIFYEYSNGDFEFSPKPIRFSTWVDLDGYKWVRVDDYGMGMDEDIILNYFLKVGKSYYQTEKFMIEQLNWKDKFHSDFLPISRFGIGFLSCFMISERIEISTKRVTRPSCRNGIRMSMQNIFSFFIMQQEKEKHRCFPMPNKLSFMEEYRTADEFGSSISVRIEPKYDNGLFDLEKILEKYILFSPVPVTYNDKLVGGDYQNLIVNNWINKMSIPIDIKTKNKIEKILKIKIDKPITIDIYPLDLTKVSPTPCLKGQGFSCIVNPHIDEVGQFERRLSINFDFHKKSFSLSIQYRDNQTINHLDKLYDIRNNIYSKKGFVKNDKYAEIMYKYNEAKRDADIRIEFPALDKLKEYMKYVYSDSFISHNGINVPVRDNEGEILVNIDPTTSGVSAFCLALSDNLRPSLSLSRDELKGMSWEIYSAICLSFYRAMRDIPDQIKYYDVIRDYLYEKNLTYGDIIIDKSIRDENGWPAEKIINTDNGKMSLNEIKEYLEEGDNVVISDFETWHQSTFFDYCTATLLQFGLSIRYEYMNDCISIFGNKSMALREELNSYKPMFFIEYDYPDILQRRDYPININHKFSQWLLNNTDTLRLNYPGLFESIISSLSGSVLKETECEQKARALNSILNRLNQLNYKNAPKADFVLSIDDFLAK